MPPKKLLVTEDIEDPFDFLANGMAIDEEHLFDETPVDIQEFIESQKFLNLKWDGKRGCRPRIMAIAKAITSGHVREAMLILGKGCLAGDTLITLADGSACRMDKLYEKYGNRKTFDLINIDQSTNEQKISTGAIKYSGRKTVYQIELEDGKKIKATDNHKFITIEGKKHLRDIGIGTNVVVSVGDHLLRNVGCAKVKSIEKLRVEKVYDITIKTGGNDNLANYCANGICSSNSGKDFISSILHLYGIYKCLCMTSPQKYYGLSLGSPIYFVNCARNEEQAKRVFFAEFKGMLENCPWFEGKYSEPAANSIRFDKKVVALSATSQAFSWLGYNTIQWVGDELAFFLVADKDEESDSRAEECWEAAFGSCQTRFRHHYKMIGITTPRFDDDFVMRKFHELSSRDDAFTAQAATWEMNPLLTIDDFKYALERNFRRTMRDFGAQPMGSIESFWADPEFVEENVCETCRQCRTWQNRKMEDDNWGCWDNTECRANPYLGNGNWRDWFAPDMNAEYYIHFDLSKNKDRVGFTLGHVMDYIKLEMDNYQLMEKYKLDSLKDINKEDKFEERPLIKLDAIGFIDPKSKRDDDMLKNREIYYEAILNKIVRWLLHRGFNLVKATFDQYQSHQFKQALEDIGIETELISLDRNDEIPVAAKTAFTENRVEYPYSRILCKEAKNLKYINGKKVDHAKKECFTGDTKFSLLDGREISFVDAETEFGDKPFWVYSFDRKSNKIVPAKATNLGIVHNRKKIAKVTLDNGKVIECTYDHKFLLRSGMYERADKLKSGISLMPLYKSKHKIKDSGKSDYEKFRDVCNGNGLVYTHRRVAEIVMGFCGERNKIIHHKNFNSRNNVPENLEIWDYYEHLDFHTKLAKENPKTKAHMRKMRKAYKHRLDTDSEYREKIIKKFVKIGKETYEKYNLGEVMHSNKSWLKRWHTIRKMCEDKDFISRRNKSIKSAWTEEKRATHSITQTKSIDTSLMLEMISEKCSMKDLMNKFSYSDEAIRHRLKKLGYKHLLDARKQLCPSNHKVVNVELTEERKPVYCIQIEKYGNFALTAGVFVHNSKDVWDSVAGTIYECEVCDLGGGAFIGYD